MRAVRREIEQYIRSLSESERLELWDETSTAREFPGLRSLPLEQFIDALAPELHSPVLRPLHRAVDRRERVAARSSDEDE